VDGGTEVGFGPKSTLAGATDQSTPGQIEVRNPNVATKDAVTIYITAGQASSANGYIADRTKNPGNYQLVGNSCVTFGEQVLSHAGGKAPDATLPSRLILDIRNQQYQDHTVQTQ
jgi:hypothetical protein